MARTKIQRLESKSKRTLEGKSFKADTVEETYPRVSLLKRRIKDYCDSCEAQGKHYSVPGLGLFLGLRTRILTSYNPEDEDLKEYKYAIDYALQRIEAYAAERLYENRGSTKGTEFLLQNTLGYANKSDVNSKQEVEVTKKQRIKQLSDEEIKTRLERLTPKIYQITRSAK